MLQYPITFFSGNMWGICANGTEAVGCGRSETFRNCADVSVVTSTGGLPPIFAGDLRRDYPFLLYYRDLNMPRNVYPLVVRWDTLRFYSTFVLFVYIVCIRVLYALCLYLYISDYNYLCNISTVYNSMYLMA